MTAPLSGLLARAIALARSLSVRTGWAGRAWLGLGAFVLACAAPAQGQELLREVFSREFTLLVGGTPDYPEAISREFVLRVGDDPSRPYGEVFSRELSLMVATNAVPPAVVDSAVTVSPTGETAVLDWSTYDELGHRDVVAYRIYRSTTPFTDVSGLTPVDTVWAGTSTYTFSGLPAFQDQAFAVVPVDSLGGFIPAVNYAASYVLSPEVFSREYTLLVGGSPDYPQAISREFSLIVGTTAPPATVANLNAQATPDGRTVTLDWASYPELTERDVVRYDIYYSDRAIFSVAGLTPRLSRPAGTFGVVLTELPAGQDHFFAVVPVDALGNSLPPSTYAVAAVLMPEVFSREFTLLVGGVPDYPEALSREYSLMVPTAAVPAPVTGLGTGFVADTSVLAYRAVDLDWTAYPEVAQADVVRYRLYIGPSFFDNVTALEPVDYVPAGTARRTVGGLASRGIYYFAVVAEDAEGRFNPVVRSASAQATPENAGEIRFPGVVSTATTLTFGWTKPADVDAFLTGYRLYFGGATEPIELGPDATSQSFTGLFPARGYTLRVTTLDIFGNESPGVLILGATWLPNPVITEVLPVDGRVRLTWNPVGPPEVLARYAIYAESSAFTQTSGRVPVLEVSGTSAWVPNLVNGQTMHFAVAAVNISGGSDPAVTSASGAAAVDRAGPRVLSVAPAGRVLAGATTLEIVFSEPILDGTLTTLDTALTGPAGALTLSGITRVDERTYRLGFGPLLFGRTYTLRLGPVISDLSGNAMNQDGDGSNGESGQDEFSRTFTVDGMTRAIAPSDADGDGVPLLVEWMLGTDPDRIDRTPGYTATGTRTGAQIKALYPAETLADAGLYPTFSFRTRIEDQGVVILPAASADLKFGPASTLKALLISVTAIDSIFETSTYVIVPKAGGAPAPSAFMRLEFDYSLLP